MRKERGTGVAVRYGKRREHRNSKKCYGRNGDRNTRARGGNKVHFTYWLCSCPCGGLTETYGLPLNIPKAAGNGPGEPEKT